MFKHIAQFECTVNEKTCRFLLDVDTPTNVAKEMCFQFQKFIGQIEDSAREQAEAAAAEKAQAQSERQKVETITQEA